MKLYSTNSKSESHDTNLSSPSCMHLYPDRGVCCVPSLDEQALSACLQESGRETKVLLRFSRREHNHRGNFSNNHDGEMKPGFHNEDTT